MTAEYAAQVAEENTKTAAIEEPATLTKEQKIAQATEDLHDLLERQVAIRKSVQFYYDQASKACNSVIAAESAFELGVPKEYESDVEYVWRVQHATCQVWLEYVDRRIKEADEMGKDIRVAKAYLDVLTAEWDVTPEADDKVPSDPQERMMHQCSR